MDRYFNSKSKPLKPRPENISPQRTNREKSQDRTRYLDEPQRQASNHFVPTADSDEERRSRRIYRQRSPLQRRGREAAPSPSPDAAAHRRVYNTHPDRIARNQEDLFIEAAPAVAGRRAAGYFDSGWSRLAMRDETEGGGSPQQRVRRRSASPTRAGVTSNPIGRRTNDFGGMLSNRNNRTRNELVDRVRGLDLGDEDRRVGRKRGDLKSKVDRIYEIE